MADGVRLTWRNKDALLSKLKRLAPTAEQELVVENGKTAAEMAELAKRFVPVKSGDLRDSIVVTPPGGVTPDHSQGGGLAVPAGAYAVTAGNEKVRYPHLVEYGAKPHTAGGQFAGAEHPGAPAQPFFWPSFRLIRRRMRSRASRALRRAIKKVIGG